MCPKHDALYQLTDIFDQNQAEIADIWAHSIFAQASFRPGDGWLTVLRTSTGRGIAAFVTLLKTAESEALDSYLGELALECLRTGFALSEVTQALLLCKDAIIGVVQRYTLSLADIWMLNSTLDTALRWMIVRFNELYSAEHNRCLREQHEHIAAMLRIGERTPAVVTLADVLEQVAKGIMVAVETEHCDFYLVDADQRHTVPKEGIRKHPLSPTSLALFLSNSPNLVIDPFYSELMQRKTPLVSYNAQKDPRVSNPIVNAMGTKSVLAVPLIANDRVIAIAVTGTFDTYRTFTDEQIELAWSVARAAALVIENGRLQRQNQHMAALEERERLAREIHDNLAQSLSILKLQASNVDDLLHRGEIDQAQVFLWEMKHTATKAHIDAREAITSLRTSPSSAEEFGPLLRAHLEKYRNTYGIQTHLILPSEIPSALPLTAILQLTRVIQEALTNVRKHARATAVWVRLAQLEEQVAVTVEDDGQGFETENCSAKDGGGVGLQIMRERVASFGGRLSVDTQVGAGTRIVVEIPLVKPKSKEGYESYAASAAG